MKLLISLILFGLLNSIAVKSQNYFTRDNSETNLTTFTTINGQWNAINPSNNTLGAYYYQGLNFGFDINSYVSLVNGVGGNDLYFGRWSWTWKGWNKIWHSGNLNNLDVDFSAKKINCSTININVPRNSEIIDAMTIDVGSFGSSENAIRSHFFRVRDIGAGNWIPFIIRGDGNVGIGTTSPAYKLDVCGTIRAKEVKVDLEGGCDFVFKRNYKLMDLNELEVFVKTKQHLPEIASEKEMVENGVNMKDLQMKLLQKMEEMTLYIIEQNKKNELQSKEIEILKLEIELLKTK